MGALALGQVILAKGMCLISVGLIELQNLSHCP